MRLKFDVARCQGHGRCAAIAPNFVELNDEGFAFREIVDFPDDEAQLARRVVRACPEAIISIVE